MLRHHIARLAVTLVLALGMVAPVAAQDGGSHSLTLDLVTCSMRGGIPSATIAPTANPSGIGFDCIPGWENSFKATLSLAGFGPDIDDGTSVTWTALSNATYRVSAVVAEFQNSDVVITGEQTLVATLFISDRPPAEESDYPDPPAPSPGDVSGLPSVGSGPAGPAAAGSVAASALALALLAFRGSRVAGAK